MIAGGFCSRRVLKRGPAILDLENWIPETHKAEAVPTRARDFATLEVSILMVRFRTEMCLVIAKKTAAIYVRL